MAEAVTLTTPVLARAGISTLRPAVMLLDVFSGLVSIQLRPWTGTAFAPDGRVLEFRYDTDTTPTGRSLLIALNKANLSTISLEKRIMQQLQADHPELAGSVTGTPD